MAITIEHFNDFKEKYLSNTTSLSLWQWALVVVVIHKAWSYYQHYISIPTYGGIFRFSRILSTIRLARLGPEAFSRLYSKYPMILLPRLEFWIVYVQPQFLEELFRAPDEHLSFLDATFDVSPYE
ncbi:hypothetical protein M408DRAFT_13337 [Serendipita vermifera MAFF 305830]|uniref:Uncharacterized protein n=1 Tax=Serendipita vermifera MAFF 305830 TaxID=933852 RepID=A0A0C3AI34_SERVB|nr:hypothetical protein M408DRAFT_13337 [Serendipita vermifera MAFF 305830]